ncbi:putative GrpE protein [Candidatus Tremblaya phenacola PAVE]|nr:putative GrpE protein [Candidatus Tremblaya phenacola PAVE]
MEIWSKQRRELVREISEGNIESLYSEIEGSEEKFLRTKAEAENAKKLIELEVAKAKKFGVDSILAELLAVMDSLEAAISDGSNVEQLKKGVSLTSKQLWAVLEKNNVRAIVPQNQKFDPMLHQAISVLEGEEDGIVVSVLQKGYALWGRLLRPALVVVSKKKHNSNISDPEQHE